MKHEMPRSSVCPPVSVPPVTEDELHAWVDEVLAPAQRVHVAHYLEAHPQEAQRIEAYRAQRLLLRTALAPIVNEPLPPELNIRRMVESERRTSTQRMFPWFVPAWFNGAFARWAMTATVALALCLGGISGWTLRALNDAPFAETSSTGLMALGHDAVASYKLYAPDRIQPVEIRAEAHTRLAAWVRESIGRPIAIPELQDAGYRFMGGRVLASVHGASVLLMYDDDSGSRLVMLARPMQGLAQNAAADGMDNAAGNTMTALAVDEVRGFAWHDGELGYSLVGAVAPETLHPLANEVRRQIRQGI